LQQGRVSEAQQAAKKALAFDPAGLKARALKHQVDLRQTALTQQ
jgi:hypothetical protein